MARRESQGLQVALILFVLLTIGLAVFVWVEYTAAQSSHDDKLKAEKDVKTANAERDVHRAQNEILKSYLGESELSATQLNVHRETLKTLASDATMKKHWTVIRKLDAEFTKDMAKYDEKYYGDYTKDTPDAKLHEKNWRNLPPFLEYVIRKKNAEIQEELKSTSEAEAEKKVELAQKDTVIAKHDADKAKYKVDLDTEKTRFAAAEAGLKKQANEVTTKLNEANKEIARVDQEKQGIIETKEAALQQAARTIASQKLALKRQRTQTFDVADGKVTWINQAQGTVWINLGLDDGLPRRTLFSVYDKTASNFQDALPKASLEVIEILGRRLAEARIVEDDTKNPILPGDVIYSPAWVPGRKVHFGLAGWIDFNNDDRSDVQTVMNLIRINGAEIDALGVQDPNIKNFGQLNVHTRFLVIGDRPVDDAESEREWNELHTQAEAKGVEIISVGRLLTWMGYRGQVRTVTLGKGGGVRDESKIFRPRPKRPDDKTTRPKPGGTRTYN